MDVLLLVPPVPGQTATGDGGRCGMVRGRAHRVEAAGADLETRCVPRIVRGIGRGGRADRSVSVGRLVLRVGRNVQRRRRRWQRVEIEVGFWEDILGRQSRHLFDAHVYSNPWVSSPAVEQLADLTPSHAPLPDWARATRASATKNSSLETRGRELTKFTIYASLIQTRVSFSHRLHRTRAPYRS
jgi:hypothetical protein